MRPGPVVLLALLLLASAVLPGMAFAQAEHQHDTGPANPMMKQVLLYLDASGSLSPAPTAAGEVPAGTALPNGESTPVAWTIDATHNTVLEGSVFVDIAAKVVQPTVVAGGPEGAAFQVQLLHNGEAVPGASSLQKASSGVLTPGSDLQIKLFLPQTEAPLALAPGDSLGVQVSFYGLNPDGQPTVAYVTGGEQGSRIGFRLRMASLAELNLPKEAGAWPVAPLEGFDFAAAAKKFPDAKVFTLRAFQFGFHGAPISVPMGTRVILQLTIDESLSTSGEGHAGHGHAAPEGQAWDQNIVTALHGFNLQSYDPALQTVLFDGLVTTLSFNADRAGNYTFLCTVFCGTGHATMMDRLTIVGPADNATSPDMHSQDETERPTSLGQSDKPVPGPPVLLVLAGLGAMALVAARRRKA